MPKLKVKYNKAGIDALRRSPEMQAILRDQAARIAGNDGEIEEYVAQTRAVAEVYGDNRNNELLKRL